ncbi:hypothetical protein, partial [Bacillus toyonensis]|uniref:hypothetical protein n=1 Tax=Bacillus toyonensis TaxID=155322 RepID=UPI001C3F36E8
LDQVISNNSLVSLRPFVDRKAAKRFESFACVTVIEFSFSFFAIQHFAAINNSSLFSLPLNLKESSIFL